MRILIVTPTLPLPISGGRTRLFNIIKQIAGRHDVAVLSFIQPSEHSMLPTLQPHCRQIELVPFEGFEPSGKWRNRLRGWSHLLLNRRPFYAETFPVERMRPALQKLLQRRTFDIVAFEQLFLAELVDEVKAKGIPAILVEQNVESDIARSRYTHATNPVHRLRDWVTWQKLKAFEHKWVRRFPVCMAVSDQDAARLRVVSPGTRVCVVPNGVDVRAFAGRDGLREADTLLFFGSLSYGPNVDGLVWFSQQIWPLLLKARPALKLEVVGLNPPPRVLALQRQTGVHVIGFVPDIRHKLWSATMSVVPLRVGGGTRLKILESLAASCPVVSTTVGADGLDLQDGEHLLLADTPADFANAVFALLADRDLAQKVAQVGRQQVERKYDWRQIARLFEAACIQAIDLSTSSPLTKKSDDDETG